MNPNQLNDWNVAMKHFREADGMFIHEAMLIIFLREIDDRKGLSDRIASQPKDLLFANTDAWFLHTANPKHLLEAAALCKENKK